MHKANDELFNKIMKSLDNIDYIKTEDVPNIDLYMDQVTTFMDKHLIGAKRFEEDKILTKTMINNYTKNELMPPPDKKKYSKEHLFLLIFIYYLKNILSISDIQTILKPLTEEFFDGKGEFSLENIYNDILALEKKQLNNLKSDMQKKYDEAKTVFLRNDDESENDFLTTFSLICMLSFDVYMKKTIIEQIIDANLKSDVSKKETNSGKKDKDEHKE